MNQALNLDQYWGAQLSGIQFDCRAMCIVLDLHWTIDSTPCKARLRFNGVSKCEFAAERIFKSDVVELVSLEGEAVSGGLRVVGEFSNYEFTITCESVDEERLI
jgi:hypothetical protein